MVLEGGPSEPPPGFPAYTSLPHQSVPSTAAGWPSDHSCHTLASWTLGFPHLADGNSHPEEDETGGITGSPRPSLSLLGCSLASGPKHSKDSQGFAFHQAHNGKRSLIGRRGKSLSSRHRLCWITQDPTASRSSRQAAGCLCRCRRVPRSYHRKTGTQNHVRQDSPLCAPTSSEGWDSLKEGGTCLPKRRAPAITAALVSQGHVCGQEGAALRVKCWGRLARQALEPGGHAETLSRCSVSAKWNECDGFSRRQMRARWPPHLTTCPEAPCPLPTPAFPRGNPSSWSTQEPQDTRNPALSAV
ncbi:uncharacterized protein [Physeter macrocephalus]|uniref:Uncharacterized protein n=1 Tax=Physeter macrocephalus TaxID=9755 RepID=A0A9W2W6Q1_PHYMC|nr:uncharacterized protein LOC129391408 [Physeter catodon]